MFSCLSSHLLVHLVERNTCPNGYQLVDPDKSGKKNQFDLVELATQIQTVNVHFNKFSLNTRGGPLPNLKGSLKLSVGSSNCDQSLIDGYLLFI